MRPPTVLGPVPRIIAIGDLHGDFDALIQCLKLANVIDDRMNWIGKNTVVIQVGDQIDDKCRGTNCVSNTPMTEVNLMVFLDLLHRYAQAQGGGVYSLLGNHEIYNTQGRFKYVSPQGFQSFGGYEGRRKAFAPNGPMAQYMAMTRNAVMKIGDFVFVHAGLMPDHKMSLEDINQTVYEYLMGLNSKPSFIYQQGGPMNNRRLLEPDCSMINAMKIKGMIVGHMVKSNIEDVCNGKVWFTDVGMSKAFKRGKIQVLEILNNQDVKVLKKK